MKLRIKEVAKKKGFSLKKLSETTGIDYISISRYNTGTVEPPISRLQLIADTLDCEVVELLPVGHKFYHSYNPEKEWMGIVKKPSF